MELYWRPWVTARSNDLYTALREEGKRRERREEGDGKWQRVYIWVLRCPSLKGPLFRHATTNALSLNALHNTKCWVPCCHGMWGQCWDAVGAAARGLQRDWLSVYVVCMGVGACMCVTMTEARPEYKSEVWGETKRNAKKEEGKKGAYQRYFVRMQLAALHWLVVYCRTNEHVRVHSLAVFSPFAPFFLLCPSWSLSYSSPLLSINTSTNSSTVSTWPPLSAISIGSLFTLCTPGWQSNSRTTSLLPFWHACEMCKVMSQLFPKFNYCCGCCCCHRCCCRCHSCYVTVTFFRPLFPNIEGCTSRWPNSARTTPSCPLQFNKCVNYAHHPPILFSISSLWPYFSHATINALFVREAGETVGHFNNACTIFVWPPSHAKNKG